MGQDGRSWCRDESGLLLISMMSLGQQRVCVPTASGWSRIDKEIYKVKPRRMPRYSRVSYHQKGTRTRDMRQTTSCLVQQMTSSRFWQLTAAVRRLTPHT